MKVKCDYCGSFIDDTEDICPNCGAANSHMMRSGDGVPKTIEELKTFCQNRSLPLEKMRFYIGEDFKEPKAFGIYKDADGNFIVYKNKGDGTRAERYRGTDEAYAVNEIYQKLRSEIQIRRDKYGSGHSSGSGSGGSGWTNARRKSAIKALVLLVAIIVVSTVITRLAEKDPNRGYYDYNGSYYYYLGSNTWYMYDDVLDSWEYTTVDGPLYDSYADYWQGSDYDSQYGFSDFEDTSYYYDYITNSSSYNDNWDNGDWDVGGFDWDIGDTDWDTDW